MLLCYCYEYVIHSIQFYIYFVSNSRDFCSVQRSNKNWNSIKSNFYVLRIYSISTRLFHFCCFYATESVIEDFSRGLTLFRWNIDGFACGSFSFLGDFWRLFGFTLEICLTWFLVKDLTDISIVFCGKIHLLILTESTSKLVRFRALT